MQYNLAKSTVIAVMKKTDQEIIVSRKHKSGLEIGVKLKTRLMTTKNAVEVWGGCCTLYYGMTKTDQEIIVSRKHKSGLEIEVLRLYQSGVEMQGFEHYGCMTTKNAVEIEGVSNEVYDDNKKCTRRGIA